MIAAIVPIGDPRVNGYGHVLDTCLSSISEFADLVVIVQNQQAVSALYKYIDRISRKNIETISDPLTWFTGGRYDGEMFNKNIEIGEEYAANQGADVFITLSSNWYIPRTSMVRLRMRCETVETWDYIYRGNQVGGRIFSASKRLPMVWRDTSGCRYSYSPDGLNTPGGFIPVERGDYSKYDGEMVIDVPFELTLSELEGRLNFFRCYHDNLPKRNPVFDWGYWEPYYLDKMQDWKIFYRITAEQYADEIRDGTRADYVGAHLMGKLGNE